MLLNINKTTKMKKRFKLWDIANSEMIKSDFVIVGINGFVFVSDEKNSRDYVTVLEFIGLHDRHENEICEGDIVKCWDNDNGKEHIGIIEYTSPCFSLKIPGELIYDGGAVKQWENDVFLDHWCNAENIEILGNIYENKNILNATKVKD